MAVKQIHKRIKKVNVPQRIQPRVSSIENKPMEVESIVEDSPKEPVVVKNKRNKKENAMKLDEIAKAEELVNGINKPEKVKIIKKERGLIERTESQKIILAEDNRQILND